MGEEIFRFGAKSAKPPCSPEKVSDKSLNQIIGPRHPLFWGSNSEQGAQEQAQVKAGRRDLVPLSEILCSLECGSAQSAFVKDVLEAAFQVHAALAQKRFARLALNSTRSAMKSFPQRSSQSFLATPGSVGVSDYCANVELLDLGNFLDGKVAFIRGKRAHDAIFLVGYDAIDHFYRRGYPLAQSLRVGVVTLQNFSLYNSSAFQIAHMLGLINHVAGSVLGAPHLGLRIVRVLPLFIARLASRPILIEAAHRGLIPGVNAFLFRQFLHILPIGLFRITMYQSAQTRIGFHHTGIDSQMPTFEKPVRFERREHHLQNPLVNLRSEPLPDHTQAAVIGRALFQTVSQKCPNLARKIHRLQMFVQFAVKTLARSLGDSRALDPKLLLLLFSLSLRKHPRFYLNCSQMTSFSTVC